VRHPELLAGLPDDVCRPLAIDLAERTVMINHSTVAHIFHQRPFDDAAAIMDTLVRRRFDPIYYGRDLTDARSFFILEAPYPRARDLVRIVLKVVRASTSASGRDEIWIATANLVGDSTLNRMMIGNRFVIQQRRSDR
jgi:hypothetical protein